MQPLVPYGYLVIVLMAGLILIPYLRGKTDLVTGWNCLLVGIAIYTGLGCIAAVYLEFFWTQLDFNPTTALVSWYLTYSIAFLIALLAFYYFNPLATRLASRSLHKWPPMSLPLVLYLLTISAVIVCAAPLFRGMAFLGPISMNMAHKAVVFSTVFAFALWYRNKLNTGYLAIFIGVLIAAGLYSMLVFIGRRLLLSVAVGPVLYIYWTSLRYRTPKANLLLIGSAMMVVFLVGTAYGSFRHFSKGVRGEERTVGAIVRHVKELNLGGLFESSTEQVMRLPQQNVQYSMLVKQSIDQKKLTTRPLNTLVLLASYPIPRALWRDKPRTIGNLMPNDVMGLSRPGLNWGVGPPGHAAFEGGIMTLVLYAFLIASLIRFLDEPLKRDPSNPFLISILASAAPHLVGYARGDFGIMSLETIECFVFAVVIGIGGRILFGTAQVSLTSPRYPTPATYRTAPPGQRFGRQNNPP
jgi:hypothetical protein